MLVDEQVPVHTLYTLVCMFHAVLQPLVLLDEQVQYVYSSVHVSCCPPAPGVERLLKWCEEMQGEIRELQRRQMEAVVHGALPPTPTSPQSPLGIHEATWEVNKQYLTQLDCAQVSRP